MKQGIPKDTIRLYYIDVIEMRLGKVENKEAYWAIRQKCYGRGKKNFRLRRKSRLRFQIAFDEFEKNKAEKSETQNKHRFLRKPIFPVSVIHTLIQSPLMILRAL